MEIFDLASAFAAGILSFLSPCILPLLPGYLSFLTGYTIEETGRSASRWKALRGALVFGLGFTIVFVLLGATATAGGRLLLRYQHIFSTVMGVVVIIFGLHMAGIFQIRFLYNEKKIHIKADKNTKHPLLQAFLLGLAFAAGWTPCIGPILGGILTMAAHQEHVRQGMILLTFYSAGLWMPFLIAALFAIPVLRFLGRYPKTALWAQRLAGVLLVVMGVLLVTGYMTRLSALLG